MKIARLSDEKELIRLFAFRYRIFVEELGWMARKDSGAHILVDEFDMDAANYAAYDDSGELVGSLRVIRDGPWACRSSAVGCSTVTDRTGGWWSCPASR